MGQEPVDKEILEGETRLMNIFYLHPDPLTAAEMHCDKHCVKMILETAQMLCTAHRTLDGDEQADKLGMYKTVHLNHPSTKWVRGSLLQYEWAYHLFKFLCSEYTHRFNKVHKTDAKLREVLKKPPYFLKWVLRANGNPPLVPSSSINTYTSPPQCMPDQYKVLDDAVQAYRNYYIGEKAYFAKWAYTRTPEWWTVH